MSSTYGSKKKRTGLRQRMRENPELNDNLNVGINLLGVGLAVASLALALNRKPESDPKVRRNGRNAFSIGCTTDPVHRSTAVTGGDDMFGKNCKTKRKASMNISGAGLDSMKRVPLQTQQYPGIYVMDDGRIVEMHEWLDPDWYGDEQDEWSDEYADEYEGEAPPKGSIYYDTFDRNGPLSGGVMGYDEYDDLTAFEQFESSRINALIIREGDPEYEDLLDALQDGRYDEVRDRFGLPNRKAGRR